MRRLTVEKGLLRQTEVVQDQIEALVRCDVSFLKECLGESRLTTYSFLALMNLRMSYL